MKNIHLLIKQVLVDQLIADRKPQTKENYIICINKNIKEKTI
jgi:hypothetical protein